MIHFYSRGPTHDRGRNCTSKRDPHHRFCFRTPSLKAHFLVEAGKGVSRHVSLFVGRNRSGFRVGRKVSLRPKLAQWAHTSKQQHETHKVVHLWTWPLTNDACLPAFRVSYHQSPGPRRAGRSIFQGHSHRSELPLAGSFVRRDRCSRQTSFAGRDWTRIPPEIRPNVWRILVPLVDLKIGRAIERHRP